MANHQRHASTISSILLGHVLYNYRAILEQAIQNEPRRTEAVQQPITRLCFRFYITSLHVIACLVAILLNPHFPFAISVFLVHNSIMHIIVCGSVIKDSSIDFSISLAAILALFAKSKTLLVDFGETPGLTREHLNLSRQGDLEPLVDHFLANYGLSSNAFLDNIAPIDFPSFWNPENNRLSFNVLTGPAVQSSHFLNLFRDHFAVDFLKQIISCADRERFTVLIINCEHNLATIWSQFIIGYCSAFVLRVGERNFVDKVDFAINPNLERLAGSRRWFFPTSEEKVTVCYNYSSEHRFPSREFLTALVSGDRKLRREVSKCAFHFSKILFQDLPRKIALADGQVLSPTISLSGD